MVKYSYLTFHRFNQHFKNKFYFVNAMKLAVTMKYFFWTEPKMSHGCIQCIGNCIFFFSCIGNTNQTQWYSKKNCDPLCLSNWSSSLLELLRLSCQLFNCRENYFSHHFFFSIFINSFSVTLANYFAQENCYAASVLQATLSNCSKLNLLWKTKN